MRKITIDNLPHIVDCLIRKIRKNYFSLLMRFVCRWWGVKVGKNCLFNGRSYFRRHPNSELVIGNNCKFNSSPNSNLIGVNRACIISTLEEEALIKIGDFCGFSGTVISAAKQIIIGKNVRCGANTLITDTDWHTDDPRAGKPTPVIIEDEVWLGLNVTVLKGVRIGKGTLVGANSLVTKSLPAEVIAAGHPAKVIRELHGARECSLQS